MRHAFRTSTPLRVITLATAVLFAAAGGAAADRAGALRPDSEAGTPGDTARAPVTAQTGPKIYISADMEGLAGVVTGEQLGPTGFEYQRFRQFMTEEVLAAIEGARAGGAGEILVSDSHGNGQNLLIEMIPDDIEIVRSWPRPLMMMEGIDETFDGAIFIGYHAGTTNPDGVRAHTMSSARLTDVRINGVSMPEAGINAAIAGHFGVPVIMLSGDDAIAAEAQAIIGDMETAVVKRAISFHAARTMTPAAAQALIRETAERAVRRIDEFRPFTVATPITAEVRFKNYQPSQLLALLPMFERPDAHAVRFTAVDMTEASAVFEFILDFGAVIEP
ncbi:MAG: M55 family metallopeptidase [Acidobacteriota bacterium]